MQWLRPVADRQRADSRGRPLLADLSRSIDGATRPFPGARGREMDVVHGTTWPSIACLKFARKTERRPAELRTFVASKGSARAS